jgi:carbamoyl-phosphate synthase large subunit
MSDPKHTTVLVTGVGGGAFGAQVYKALRLAERTPYRIVAADITAQSWGFPDADETVVLPRATHADYLGALLEACERYEVAAVFPGSEPELPVLAAQRAAFTERNILLAVQPEAVLNTCLDKVTTTQALAAAGFPVVPTRRIASVDEALDWAPAHLPVVLKPATGGGGSTGVVIAQTRAELEALAGLLLADGHDLMAQAYIGTPGDEYTVGVLCDLDGELVNSIGIHRDLDSALSRRLRVANRCVTERPELGPHLVISSGISQGHAGRYPDITGPCEAMAKALGAAGPINLQVRVHAGSVYVFEVNPRFSGTTSLRAMVGYNEPDVLVRHHILGETIPRHFPYREGTILRGLCERLMP